MNREIKIRFWNGREKHMLYPEFWTSQDLVESNDWKTMQYVGLKDKNGREIYESDLVKCPVDGRSSEYLQLEADGKDFVMRIISIPEVYMEGLSNDCEVIGNSFENPNLLNKEK